VLDKIYKHYPFHSGIPFNLFICGGVMDTSLKSRIIISDNMLEGYKAAIRPWGIVLPKDKFASIFTSEKNVWPISSEEFMLNTGYIGVKWFGTIYSSVLDRQLGFEVVKSSSGTRYKYHPLSELGILLEKRECIHDSLTDDNKRNFYDSITSDMFVVQKYFSKAYKGIDLSPIVEKENPEAFKLVDVLKACFPE
jgi:hypothetical protein